jgi:hypothetical protein
MSPWLSVSKGKVCKGALDSYLLEIICKLVQILIIREEGMRLSTCVKNNFQ